MRMPGKAIIFGSALLAVLTLSGFLMLRQMSERAAPSWLAGVTDCRDTPMAHVHDPERLVVLGKCATVSGTVKSVELIPAYDDVKLTIVPDGNVAHYLRKANRGLVVADVIATDQASVVIPPVDSRITAWGSWVVDKASKTTRLLPAYHVRVDQLHAGSSVRTGRSAEKHGPPPKRQLQLSLVAPHRVPVGGRIDVLIKARWLQERLLKPASEIRLFTEMTTRDNVGVRWKAIMTHTDGMAALHLVAIQVPATYTLTVYAAPSHEAVTATAVIEVSKS
jgi:hypothetical protein